ncbi:MAG: type toxin-antitoxin system HigB family toxin [Planctomycetaceae bacterium]|nr:type toxin-antitoxin system HigB family toxin [Planctomycetaceae bacterium]
MRVISKSRLQQFWELPGYANASGPLRAWYTHVNSKAVSWHSWAEVKSDFATASLIGNCVVFNIGGNKYRLITRILYASQKVFVLKVMNHAEYDNDKWKSDCGCFQPPFKSVKTTLSNPSNPDPKGTE